jgi:hypothetical protein
MLISLLCLSAAFAEDSETPPPAEPAPEAPPVDLTQAQPAPPLSRRQYSILRPWRGHLPPDSYAQVDYTAYSLKWGEVRLGLSNLTIGVLPRTQLGTVPLLNAVGMFNGNLKVNPLRVGPLDMAASATIYDYNRHGFHGRWYSGGGDLSLKITNHWSLHGGATYTLMGLEGAIETGALGELVSIATNNVGWERIDLTSEGHSVRINLATDVRFNRRDSLILQSSATVWGDLSVPIELPAPLGGGLDEGMTTMERIQDSYTVSLSYQAAFRHLEARVGVGLSAQPYMWVQPAFELCYRFGGETRRSEARMRATWRGNRGDVKKRTTAEL